MNTTLKSVLIGVTAAAVTTSLPGIASQVTSLVTFSAGTPAKASEVNGNFTAVKTAVDDNQAQITALNARIALLESKLTNVTALNDYLSLQTVNGHPTVRVSAANFQIVNGMNKTDSINGTGNLIVGYDETAGQLVMSDATTFEPINREKTGSHNLVIGAAHSYRGTGGIVSGFGNLIYGSYSAAIGGANNTATSLSVVLGGYENNAAGEASIISGGRANFTTGRKSVIGGGYNNRASGVYSVVTGGAANSAEAYSSVVGGGAGNIADDDYGVVSGGDHRFTNQIFDWVGGPYSGK